MRRKYLDCSVVETSEGFAPALDGKTMRTPAGLPFLLPNRALAEAVAVEWNAVGEKAEIDPKQMPVTRLATTAIDRARTQRDQVIDEITAYGRTDLLCYRAEQPASLVERQNVGWNPWLDWLQTRFGVSLAVTQGVMPIAQDEAAIEQLRQAVARFDDFALSGLFNLTVMLGSLVLALAVLQEELDVERAADLAEIDAVFQAERWGEDHFAIKRRRDVRHDIAQVGKYLALLSPSGL